VQDPPKFTPIWIFGLKTNHLATLVARNFLLGLFVASSESEVRLRLRKNIIEAILISLNTSDVIKFKIVNCMGTLRSV
jgi:hypothetical protein